MAQNKNITQSAATMSLNETTLGWDPLHYAAHTISYHGGGAHTATVYGYPKGQAADKIDIITLGNQDAITVGRDTGPWKSFEVSFSDVAGTSARIVMTSKASSVNGDY